MLDQSIIEKIQEYAVFIDWHVAFGGKACGNRHLFRVVTIASFLAAKEGANAEICEAGAWLHDIGLTAGNDDDPPAIRKIAEEYLTKLELDERRKKEIADCVETHEGTSHAASLEAMVVHDADVLDKMGLLGVIRHTWKIVNLISPEAKPPEVYTLIQQHLQARRENLYTETARKIVRTLNEAQHQFFIEKREAVENLEIIMHYARLGVTSDEIASKLLLKKDNQTLALQISISNEILQWWYAQK